MLPKNPDDRARVAEMRRQVANLKAEQAAHWEWMLQNAASAEFIERARAANVVAGRIDVLQQRIENLILGEPEMGTRYDTVTPLTKTPFT